MDHLKQSKKISLWLGFYALYFTRMMTTLSRPDWTDETMKGRSFAHPNKDFARTVFWKKKKKVFSGWASILVSLIQSFVNISLSRFSSCLELSPTKSSKATFYSSFIDPHVPL
jgi:hypothetical protein